MRDPVGRLLMRWRIAVVVSYVQGRLLDVGCGTNELVAAYDGDGVGVDVHQWGNVDYLVKNTSNLPFEDGSFDTVTIIAALNHIPNRAEVLCEVHRLLRAGGRLIVTMLPPRISRVWHALRHPWDADQMERGMKEGEVYGLRASHVRDLLKRTGFEVRREQRFMLGINRLTVGDRLPA